MNQARRKDINAIVAKLEEVKSMLDDPLGDTEGVAEEEQEYFDNMPESLQGSEKGELAQEAAQQLETAKDGIESAISSLEEAIEALQEACGG